MDPSLAGLWTAILPKLQDFAVLVVSTLLSVAAAKIIAWANAEKVAKATAEAVVAAHQDPTLITGPDMKAAVLAAVPKATSAQIEVAYQTIIAPLKAACPPAPEK
jgi:hypothetical protein